MALLQATFHCRVLSPLFLSGMDQKRCEFRAASLRGALRAWYRALLGGRGVTDITALQTQEAAVFGSTEAVSPVGVRIDAPPRLWEHLGTPNDLPDWQADDPDHPGLGSPTRYLWYSADLGSNERRWIPPGTTFRVTLHTLATGRHAAARRQALEEALVAFWLVAHLGGLGSRARRAAGSFSARLVAQRGTFSLPPFSATGTFDPDQVERYLGTLLPNPTGASPAFSVLNTAARVWQAGFDEPHWEDAVWNAGAALRSFRLRLGLPDGPKANPAPPGFPDDYLLMKEGIQTGQAPPSPVGRVGFGLPLTFRFRRQSGSATLAPNGENRRASPLWLRIVELPTGRYDAVLTYLGGQLLPGQVAMGGQTFAPPVQSLVPHFARSIASRRQLFPTP